MLRLLKTCSSNGLFQRRLTTATINPLVSKYQQQLAKNEKAAWQTYLDLKSTDTLMTELSRDDFLKLRTNLWSLKKENWGTEDRIIQVLEDMKSGGHAWTISEYNEYFIAKFFQAQYNDILSLYKTDLVSSHLKLSVGSFNVILATHVQLGQMDQAIQFVKEANSKWDVVPNIRDFDRTMNRCMSKNSVVVNKAKELIKQYGLSSTKVLNTNLLYMFKEKRSSEIKWIMEGQKNKKLDITTYNILIKGYCDARLTRDASEVYTEMKRQNVKPNNYICSSMLGIFAHTRDVVSAEELVRNTILGGHTADEVVYNQLIKVYFKARQPQKAFQAFQEVQNNPNLQVNDVILNTMIDGLVINREVRIAGLLYDSMIKSQFKPDMITFNTMLKGYIKANEMESAMKIISDMFKYNMEPDTVTYTILIDSMFVTRQPKSTEEILQYIDQMKIKPNVFTYNAIMNNWIKQRCMEKAESTLGLMIKNGIKPTVHTFTNLIQGYTEEHDLNKAMETYKKLMRSGIQPDRATFNFMIVGFLNADRLNDAYACLEHMKSSNLSPTKDTWRLILQECSSKKDWVIGKQVINLIDASDFEIKNESLKRTYTILPNELLLYLFRNFLDLADLWSLYQTNSELRIFSSTVIASTWKIDTNGRGNDITMKMQCRTALISLGVLASQQSMGNDIVFFLTGSSCTAGDLINRESQLHLQIIQGISSYKHKYVLIEDIDIRNRIRTAVDVVFHHAVFVSAIHKSHDGGALAAILVRLLSKLDVAFPSYCREITYTLADNIKAFLEYTGYKIMASTTNTNITLDSIFACFDLMGAAFVGKILSDSHVDCAVQRTCELLSNHVSFKKKLLIHLLEHWLTVKREVGSGELCRYIRLEIEKCDAGFIN
ncbi:hypothetical protein INT47_001364 [Mucor saturninus]|uniref:Pentatricopeptide repeat-containing protein n=1 Tax=Mucor saturninus TaxID=64648 RepID=A0A8H7QZZ8_9FUNG|nr:hypothetical protein INT47_001364 [Mucor saturninus]